MGDLSTANRRFFLKGDDIMRVTVYRLILIVVSYFIFFTSDVFAITVANRLLRVSVSTASGQLDISGPFYQVANTCTGPFTLILQNQNGTPASTPVVRTILLSTSPGTATLYSNSGCSTTITSIQVPANNSVSNQFWLINTAQTTVNLNANATSFSGGTLSYSIHGNKSALTYTGANQTFNVPAGVTSITAKLWGGAGGGGKGACGPGGAGGYVMGTLAVTPSSALTVIVGGGGGGGTSSGAGGGGGRSAIRPSANDVLTAAGGGGAGSGGKCSPPNVGGAGGGLTGEGGGSSDGYVSFPGTQTAGGAATNDTQYPGKPGTQYAGGSGFNTAGGVGGFGGGANGAGTGGGGGGGGGYFGGGGGSGANNGGAAGGSSYFAAAGVTKGSTIAGSGAVAPNTSDTDYASGISVGGPKGSGTGNNPGSAGGNGQVVIYY